MLDSHDPGAQVAVIDAELACPLGTSLSQVWAALQRGESGLAYEELHGYPTALGRLRADIGNRTVSGVDLDRGANLALHCIDQLRPLPTMPASRGGVFWGVGLAGAHWLESSYQLYCAARGAAKTSPWTVDVGSEEGVFEQEEKEMLHNIFDFGDLQVRDIMVQRVDITALDVDATYEEVLEIVKDEQFSRFPVYREDIDDIIGILNVKDLLFLTEVEKRGFKLEDYIREPYFAYEFKRITDLFKELKKTRTHISIILDEYGGTVGIVTIEDLLEEIVGEIDDEYDDDKETDIETIRKNEYMVSGSYRLDELNELIGTDIESEEFDSIGGYLIGILGTFPASGEVIEADGIRFVVDEVDKNRIKKIRMILKPKQTEF